VIVSQKTHDTAMTATNEVRTIPAGRGGRA
jgi:hypothetical protein